MEDVSHAKRTSIDVLIRVRPMRADLQETKPAWEISDSTLREKGNPDSLFTFDYVYRTDATTKELYERSIRSGIVSNVVKGYNGTVFAYGQTGSGKSYTMFGDGGGGCGGVMSGSISGGLVALSIRDLFSHLEQEQQRNPSMQVSVFVTMIEIYNEQLRDLLLPSQVGATVTPLSIRENEHGVYVHNAVKREVHGERECTQLIQMHTTNRVNASTAMNEHSSRSHCVIRVLVEKTIFLEDDSETTSSSEGEHDGGLKKKFVSTLNLVDLAGSERVAKTGSTGLRMVEGGHINKSLSILTTVISRLTEIGVNNNKNSNGGTGSGFVPYRDSRLTHLLKTAIGGNSLTAVLCCITPALQHVDESRSTLQFAARVKAIQNRVLVNEVVDPKTRLRELEAQLRRYKRMVVVTTLHLWSKSVRNNNLQKQISELLLSRDRFPSSSCTGSEMSPMSANERQGVFTEKLMRQNEMLRQELANLRDALERCSGGKCDVDGEPLQSIAPEVTSAIVGLADDEEKQQLRADVRDMEQMLKEALDEKHAIQQSMDELDNLCKELEEESAAKASSVEKLQERCKELEELVKANNTSNVAAKEEVALLKEQLAKSRSRMLEKGSSDDYLQQLTKLHIEQQELMYAHHQLQDKYTRAVGEEQLKVKELHARIEELEDEVGEVRDVSKLQNSYLWRFISLASVVTHGKAVDPEEFVATVRGLQVDAAIKTLTTFLVPSLQNPPGALESSEGDHQKRKKQETRQQQQEEVKEEPQQEEGGRCASDAVGGSGAGDTGEAALLERIEELQHQIFLRDSQRDVIVDCKLKCMQNLVLRLHTSNAALVEEMRRSFSLNEELFRFVDKNPKLSPKLAKAGLAPMSFKTAMERVRRAKVPTKPYGHN